MTELSASSMGPPPLLTGHTLPSLKHTAPVMARNDSAAQIAFTLALT